MSPELWHNQTHMTPLKAITISCLSLSLRSVTSTFNQQLLLSKSFSSTTNTMEQSILDAIGKISLSPIDKGALKDETKIDAGALWAEGPVLIYVVRRPGCPLCREEALGISTRFKNGDFKGASLFGVVKELAPIKGAATDEILGVNEFHEKYFNEYPLFLDHNKAFYSVLGNKNLLRQSLSTWNPLKLYNDYKELKKRMKSQGIKGNLVGEGLIQGGVLIVHPTRGIIYQHNERTGAELPYEAIRKALKTL